ncbi:hypothetical protein QE152_g12437 [Popillia japonica]|uniref:Uncharacterized protein n=1 Tax=Popillia japonica TaxID=7064 RepID=A0AAW1LRL3_POPJA
MGVIGHYTESPVITRIAGKDCNQIRIPSSTNLPSEIITTLETEEDLNGVLSELHRKTDENVKVLNENMNEDIEIITTLETEEDLNGVLSELHRKTDENENMNEDIDGLEESNISNEILITNSIGMNVTLPLASSLESVVNFQSNEGILI